MPLRRRHRRDSQRARAWPPGWDVPARFNFTRDVIEGRARDLSARAMTYVDDEGLVDRRGFAEVARDAARWAHALRARIPHPGETVLVVAGNQPEAYLAVLGALKGGLVAVPCPVDLRAAELAYRVGHARAALVVADRRAEAEIVAMLDAVDRKPDVLFLDDAGPELRRYPTAAPTEDTAAADRALLLYTSGTGAEPKAVVHTHAAVWGARAAAEHWLGAREGDLVWTTARAGWAEWAWHGLLGPWSVGAEVVVDDAPFEAERRLDLLQRLKVSVLCQSPTQYRALIAAGATAPGALHAVRAALSTGEALEAGLVEAYADAGLALRDGLGQAECGLLAGTLVGELPRPGVLGTALPGHELAVLDGDGNPVAAGEEGVLGLRGRPPTLFTEYLDAAGATSAAFVGEWYLTGDRCTMDEGGALRYVGRDDDVIVSGGLRIGPAEVEAAVGSHPLVADVAAVASPDIARGAVVKVFVTLNADADPPEDLETVLAAHAASIASQHLVPERVEVVEELPRTATGKLRRAELRRLEQERHADTAAALEQAARLAAAAAAEQRARALAEQEERHRAERREARERAEEEHRQALAEAEERRRREAEQAAHAQAEAERRRAVQLEAERAAEAEREQRERQEREAAAQRERAARDAERAAEAERQRRERQEREAAEKREREARHAERAADVERRLREQQEREAAAQLEREAREAERAAEAERQRQEREAAAERERAAEAERQQREQQEREAAAERERAARAAEAERQRREQQEREAVAERERQEREAARRAEEERKLRERAEREAVRRRGAREPKPSTPLEEDVILEAPIPGLADRIRTYSNTTPPGAGEPAEASEQSETADGAA